MYCGKCGTKLDDNARFCPSCGEAIPGADAGTKIPLNVDLKKYARPAGIVAGAVLVVVLLFSLFGGGYKKTLDNYYKAIERHDADLMYSSITAQYWIDYTNEGWGNSAYDSIKSSIEHSIDDWDCGDNIKITYEVKNERRATKEELEDLEDNIYDWYAYYVYDRDEFSITDAYILDIDFTVKGDEGTESFHYPDGLLIIKENGEWRIPRGSISCSFYDNQ